MVLTKEETDFDIAYISPPIDVVFYYFGDETHNPFLVCCSCREINSKSLVPGISIYFIRPTYTKFGKRKKILEKIIVPFLILIYPKGDWFDYLNIGHYPKNNAHRVAETLYSYILTDIQNILERKHRKCRKSWIGNKYRV